ALHVLHDDVVAVGSLIEPGVEDLHDVGVLEAGGRHGLAPEAGHERLVVGEVLGQQLHGHAPLEHRVHRHEHGGHAAGAEAALDRVAARDLGGSAHGFVVPPGPVPPFGGTTPPPPLLSDVVDVLVVEVLVLVELVVVVVLVVVGVVLLVVLDVVVVSGRLQSRWTSPSSRRSPATMLFFTSGSTLEGSRAAASSRSWTFARAPLHAPESNC